MRILLAIAAIIASCVTAKAATLNIQAVTQAGSAGACGDSQIVSNATISSNLSFGCSITGPVTVGYRMGGNTAARASFGSIGVGVSSTAAVLQQPSGSDVSTSQALASLSDTLTSSVISGWVSVPIDLAGQTVFSYFRPSGGDPGGIHSFALMSVTAWVGGIAGQTYSSIFSAYTDDVSTSPDVTTGSLGVTNLLVPLIGGQASFGLSMMADARCASGTEVGTTCSSTIDFFSSARFLAATVFDASGNLVLGASLSSSSGFNYLAGVNPHPAPVPVPVSGMLLLSGLAGLHYMRKRSVFR